MSHELVPAANHGLQAIDSLVANEFELLIDGQPVSGIFTVTGLVTFQLEVKATNQLRKTHEPFRITKMVQRDPENPFNVWMRETYAAGSDIVRPTRTLTILAVDDGVLVRRWTIRKAWICEIAYSDFNSGSSEMIEERITIRYEDIEDAWPLQES
jgi:hypothetical protein